MRVEAKIFFFMLALCSGSAFAVTEQDKMVDRVGVQSGNVAYFDIKGGLAANCKFGIVYLDLSSDFGKAAYANILATQTAGRKLSRLEYNQSTSDGTCHLWLAEARS